jgi:cell shape-determining protein MreC
MARTKTFHTPLEQRLWWGTIVAALVLSFLPTRWLLGWTSEVAGVVNSVLVPFQHVASGVRTWLRPMPDPDAALPADLQAMRAQLEQARTYYKRLELERAALEERLATLERTTARAPTGERSRAVYATVVSTQAPSSRSAGALITNAGSRNGVVPGMVAVWDDTIVAGRVAENVGRLGAVVIPVTALSGVQVRFVPPDDAAAAQGVMPTTVEKPSGILANDGRQGWTTDVTQPGAIAAGWIAVIDDERWPMSARALKIGVVDHVGPRDDAPLHRRVVVKPLVDPFRVPHVVLLDDASDAPAGSGAGP